MSQYEGLSDNLKSSIYYIKRYVMTKTNEITVFYGVSQRAYEHCKTLNPNTATIISADEEYPNN